MKLLKQIVYEVQQNKKINIYVEPQDKQAVEIDESDYIEEEYGGMLKQFPTGATEGVVYDVSELYDIQEDSLTDVINYLQYQEQYPPQQIYSLLNVNVELKDFIINEDDILLGTIPNIVSILQPSTADKTIAQRFGLVYKDKYYYEKYNAVKNLLGKETNLILPDCNILSSTTSNRSREQRMFYVTGNVVSNYEPYYNGTEDAYIEGVSYDSRGYDVDYYNKSIIPYKVTSTVSSSHTAPVQNLFYENNGDGGYTEKSFSKKIESITKYEYIYVGNDPLQKKITVDTNMYGENYINLNDFLILAHIGSNNQFKKVIIANRNESEYMVSYSERTHNNYQKEIVKDVSFYKQTSVVKSRQEDCLIATVNGEKTLYSCFKGASVQQGLSNIISLMTTADREQLTKIDSLPIDPKSNIPDIYYTLRGTEMIPIRDYEISNGGSLHILNDVINIEVGKERFERSILRMVPLGKTNSHRYLYSEKVGQITQDFDSKEFIGGGVPLKTYTTPTYVAKASSGSGKNIKSSGQGNDKFSTIGYSNAVYYSEDDVQIVADNFALINEYLVSMNINFKGVATINDLESFFDTQDFILDKVNQDLGKNTTSFTCRTVLFN